MKVKRISTVTSYYKGSITTEWIKVSIANKTYVLPHPDELLVITPPFDPESRKMLSALKDLTLSLFLRVYDSKVLSHKVTLYDFFISLENQK